MNVYIYEKLFKFTLNQLQTKQEIPVITFFKDLFHKLLEEALNGNGNKSFMDKFLHTIYDSNAALRKYIAENDKEYEELRIKIRISNLGFKEKSHSY